MAVDRKTGVVTYRKSSFNPLFWEIEKLLGHGVIEFYIYGGKASAKTATICQVIAKKVWERRQNALFLRKEGSTVKRTLKQSLIKSLGNTLMKNTKEGQSDRELRLAFRVMEWDVRSKRDMRAGNPNNKIELSGLDEAEKIKGLENVNYLYMDEVNQFEFNDYLEALNALRGEERYLFASWNPVDEKSWIKTKVIDHTEWVTQPHQLPSRHSFVRISKDGKKALVKTDYHDNYWMVGGPEGIGYRDQNTIERYERMRTIDPHWYRINVLGEWGVIKPENPFWFAFDRTKHLGRNLQLDPQLPIALVFDFNIRNSCIVAQFSFWDNRYIRVLKEYRSEGMTPGELAWQIVQEWGEDYEYIISGDSSGNNGSALTKGNKGAFDIIRIDLDSRNIYYDMSKIPKSNASLYNSGIIGNTILRMENNYLIDADRCAELVSDLERMRIGRGGDLDKKHADRHDYGHLGDTLRYFHDTLLFWDFYQSYDIPERLM